MRIKAIIISLIIFGLSWIIIFCLKLKEIKILQEDFLFTYLGVFLGFALTIYTFGISMLESIKTAIDNADEQIISENKKKKFFNSILSGFNELKDNILFITFSFLSIVVLALLKNIKYPDKLQLFLDKIKPYHLLETIYLSIFLISILIIFDLLYSMFNISEILLEIIRKKINKTNN
jgi:hypothetical protein